MRNRNFVAPAMLLLALAVAPAACGRGGAAGEEARDADRGQAASPGAVGTAAIPEPTAPVAAASRAPETASQRAWERAAAARQSGDALSVDGPADFGRPTGGEEMADSRGRAAPGGEEARGAVLPVASRPESGSAGAVRLVVEEGATITLRLEETLSTSSSREGDVFRAQVVEDLLGPRGIVLVPIGSTVRGRVTEVRRSGGPDEEAILGLAFETLTVGGRVYPIRASVREAEPEVTRGDGRTETAAKIAAGTAAGALIGRILGKDKKATIAGAAVGAAAGAAAALNTRLGDATFRAGSRMVIGLDAPVVLGTP